MTLEQAERAAGISLHEDRLYPDINCATWFPADGSDVTFLALDGRLATIQAGSPVTTVEGIGAGAASDAITKAYGSDHVEKRTNRFGIREIAVTPSDPALADFGMVFLLSTTGEGVEFVRAGLSRELERDEGCA